MSRGSSYHLNYSEPEWRSYVDANASLLARSRHFGFDQLSSANQGCVRDIPPPSPGNQHFGLDYQSSTHRGYGDGRLSSSPLGNRHLLYCPSFQDNTGVAAPSEHRPFEESLSVRPVSQTSIHSDRPLPRTPPPVILVRRTMARGSRSHFPLVSPTIIGRENRHSPPEMDESELTKEEQQIVLNKLRKEVYNPMPKMSPKRVSVYLYYRDFNRHPSAKVKDKDKQTDEDGKRCAVCLEDFEPREEVMLTPCDHMFHEECIVPWVKDHGRCPVCRATFHEKKGSGSAMNNNRGSALLTSVTTDHDLFASDLISLMQAMGHVYPWGI